MIYYFIFVLFNIYHFHYSVTLIYVKTPLVCGILGQLSYCFCFYSWRCFWVDFLLPPTLKSSCKATCLHSLRSRECIFHRIYMYVVCFIFQMNLTNSTHLLTLSLQCLSVTRYLHKQEASCIRTITNVCSGREKDRWLFRCLSPVRFLKFVIVVFL